ncbi:phage tail protein [Octadecabacter sp. G9-8]|uniref:Phage tail protein n=1 Tax=Octadecabacter dasysiphoniae TaxID=2909341 RepID=A0ABS9CS49_9RHOB|nr:phage tail protein [Octadecabacter dasysiphoniae]MCF2870066.1 phage tail protein [Octadecabacter dasysiphoniae]
MTTPPSEYPQNPQRLTPYPNFRFKLKWSDSSGKEIYVAGVNRVSAPSHTTKVIHHREGGDPSLTHLAPGQTEYSAITLERGVSYDTSFQEWANKVFDFQSSQNLAEENPSQFDVRKNLIIEVYNEAGQIVLAYKVYNAWVSEFQALSDLDATGKPAVVIQSIVMENEGWERDTSVETATEPSFSLPAS